MAKKQKYLFNYEKISSKQLQSQRLLNINITWVALSSSQNINLEKTAITHKNGFHVGLAKIRMIASIWKTPDRNVQKISIALESQA